MAPFPGMISQSPGGGLVTLRLFRHVVGSLSSLVVFCMALLLNRELTPQPKKCGIGLMVLVGFMGLTMFRSSWLDNGGIKT